MCKEKNIYLVEDCAHAHGASYHGRTAGGFGFAGSYSFYATKTMPTGDGGMVVSHDNEFIEWVKKYRNYGKEVDGTKVSYPIKNGFNYRMNEFTAALGIVQLERVDEIIDWKQKLAAKYDNIFKNRVMFPREMISGYYKYIVFGKDDINHVSGKVFGNDDLGYRIEGKDVFLENSEWVTNNHQCPPIWYGWQYANLSEDELRNILLGGY